MSLDFMLNDSGETPQRQSMFLSFRLNGHCFRRNTLEGQSIGLSFGLMILQTPIKKNPGSTVHRFVKLRKECLNRDGQQFRQYQQIV